MKSLFNECVVVALAFLIGSDAFTSSQWNRPAKSVVKSTTSRTQPLYIFGRNKDEEAELTSDTKMEQPKKRSVPFFGRLNRQTKDSAEDSSTSTAVLEEVPIATVTKVMDKPAEPLSPAEQAKALRAQAERARLEAERMDASLTLSKIERLERQLKDAKKKGESVDELQRQLDNLQAKLRGEAPTPIVAPVKRDTENPSPTEAAIQEAMSISFPEFSVSLDLQKVLDNGGFEEKEVAVKNAPELMQKLMAYMFEVDYDSASDFNATEVAYRMAMAQSGDFSYSKLAEPVFTEAQVEEAIKELESSQSTLPQHIMDSLGNDKRKMAEYSLKAKHYLNNRMKKDLNTIMSADDDDDLLGALDEIFGNQTALDRLLGTSYPDCMRKEDSEEPTLAQVQLLATTVLPKTKFKASGKPEKVLGGYMIPGSYSYENGNELIADIDKQLSSAGLDDKLTVLLIEDLLSFVKLMDDENPIFTFEDVGDQPALYITGTDLARDSKPVALSIVSGLGLATSWYFSIYPFLLNSGLSSRVEDQLSVADAGMNYDLDWLTDLSVPLFLAFLGLQLLHEIGHRVAAAAADVKLSPPTLVPSLLTGITSSVTSFKSLPKTKEAMFDISVSGPLLGYLASLATLVVGAQLSLSSDPTSMPALPVDILRQSSLGGSIVDTIIQGSLYVPDGADSSGLMVSLHPLAVAGFVSMIVNALALLPVGTTDGGRMALALFGRNTKSVIGYLTMTSLLLTGVFGSDLFLFYFAFIIAFQTGNEIPARNEFDDIEASRSIIGGLGFALAFLTLIPVQ